MYVELIQDEFIKVKTFFDKNKYQIPALAVINRNFPGRIFVDNKNKPEIALIWAISRWSYISCEKFLPQHMIFIRTVLNNEIIPIIRAVSERRFEVYADNNIEWDDMLNKSLGEYQVHKHYENTFVLNKEKLKEFSSRLEVPKEIEISEINYPIVPEEYGRYVMHDEFERVVYGMTLNKNDNVISQCLNNGFICENNYFIDIDTFDNEERNKGYGTIIAYSLISNQLKKGLIPLWETTINNLPSQRVANKLGFEKIEEYPVYSITGFV
ncbi:MAG: GNAT family N-acetyltransferase [Bacillota bacterium]|nr:GNAT family N-acetyltransferase [Bacillota bacterium]